MAENPIYSICICNYNMGDTIERALISVLEQLDHRFEVLVLDDGSSDDSLSKIKQLSNRYPLLRYLALKRDRKRKLGETRNISVREAKGEYVLLHIDADDVWEPYIKDFVEVFHRIEKCLGRDVLLSGQQVNIGRREWLMTYGPYRNTHRAQDRDMWLRLAADNAYIPLMHRVFRTRLDRPRKVRLFKALRDSWHHVLYDLRKGEGTARYLAGIWCEVISPRVRSIAFRVRLMKALLSLPAWLASKFNEPLPPPPNMKHHWMFVEYRDKTAGTYAEIMQRHGCDPDLSFLREEARAVFQERPAE